MNVARAILRKECRETLGYLLIALGVFVGLPLIGTAESWWTGSARLRVEAAPWVETLGGVFAALVGVGISTRDLSGRLSAFWLSRPVNIPVWLCLKYLVGAVFVLLACIAPLALQILVNDERNAFHAPIRLLAWSPFLWLAIYSVGFLAGCVLRRVSTAAMLTVVAALLAYFLPTILPPLRPISVQWVTERSHAVAQVVSTHNELASLPSLPWLPWPVPYLDQQLGFIIFWLAVSTIAMFASILAVQRDWHVKSGMKVLYCMGGAGVLTLFASMAFQFSGSLPLLATASLPPGELAIDLWSDGVRGMVAVEDPSSAETHYALRTLTVGPSSIELGPRVPVMPLQEGKLRGPLITWDPEQPGAAFMLRIESTRDGNRLKLSRLDLTGSNQEATPQREIVIYESRDAAEPLSLSAVRDGQLTVRVYGTRILVNVSDPNNLNVASRGVVDLTGESGFSSEARTIAVFAPVNGGQTLSQRLGGLESVGRLFDRHEGLICLWSEDRLATFRAGERQQNRIDFQRASRYERSFVSRLLSGSPDRLAMGDKRVQLSMRGTALAGSTSYLAQFDLTDPARPRPNGHFAAPDEILIPCPLPDGRTLVGGRKLYLLGKAPTLDP